MVQIAMDAEINPIVVIPFIFLKDGFNVGDDPFVIEDAGTADTVDPKVT